jgi:hypothetical protein
MAGVCSTLHDADPPHRIVMMTTFFDCEFLSRQTLRLTPAGLTRTIGAAWTRLTRCSSLEARRQAPSWAIQMQGTGRDARLPLAYFSKGSNEKSRRSGGKFGKFLVASPVSPSLADSCAHCRPRSWPQNSSRHVHGRQPRLHQVAVGHHLCGMRARTRQSLLLTMILDLL